MKGKYLVISALFTIVLFLLLIYTEKKVANTESTTNVLVVKSNVSINKFDKLNASMFDVKSVPVSVGMNGVSDVKKIEGKYALSDLASTEILLNEKVGEKTPLLNIESDKRKLAIPISSLSDGVAGQIRKDTLVDIVFTNTPISDEPVAKTETILQKVKVIGVTDGNGVLVDDSNSSQVAAVILSVTPQEAHMLINKENKGKFTLLGVAQDAQTYDKVTVK